MRYHFIILLLLLLPIYAQDLDKKLPVAQSLQQGTLGNGLSYIIKENKSPAGKVEMYLHVNSGSLDEEDNEQGVAHFLEHMAFHGSKNFPAGSLIKYFESLGLTFGKHENAFTSFDQTTYTLSLPNVTETTLDKSLLCLSDFAFRLNLDLVEINKERGVIQEEQRARSNVTQRIFKKVLPELFPGSRIAQRMPTGKIDIIKDAARQRFVDYYKKWYHPQNCTLIIVGDINASHMETIINKHFKDWPQKKKIPVHLKHGIKPYLRTRALVVRDKDLIEATVDLTSVKKLVPVTMVSDYRNQLIAQISDWIVNRRLINLVKTEKAQFQSASISQSSLLNVCQYISASASGPGEKWASMLNQLVHEIKRVRVHGFHQQEVDDAVKTIISTAERALSTETTKKSKEIIQELNNAIAIKTLPMSAQQELDLLNKLTEGITLLEINSSFTKAYSAFNRLIILKIPDKDGLRIPTQEQLLKLVTKAENRSVEQLKIKERPKSLLSRKLKVGKVTSQTLDSETGVTSITLQNKAIFHHKYSPLDKDNVIIQIKFAGGKVEETQDNHGITNIAVLPLMQPATSRLSAIDIDSIMTGKKVRVNGYADDDSININITGSRKDLEDGLSLANLLITDAKIEKSVFNLVKLKLQQEIEKKKFNVNMQLLDTMQRLVAGNDPRFISLSEKELKSLNIKESQFWLKRIFSTAPVEASIVGDISLEDTVKLMSKYLGSLPERSSFEHLKKLRRIDIVREPQDKIVTVNTKTPKTLVLVAWRGPDYASRAEYQQMRMAAQIISSRLHKTIREERQLTYSVSCFAQAIPGFTNRGMVMSYFTSKKTHAREAAALCKKEMLKFAKEGPSQTELNTVQKQFKTNITALLERPSFWAAYLADLNYHNKSLKDIHKLLETYLAHTSQDIHDTTRKYFTQENSLMILVQPK